MLTQAPQPLPHVSDVRRGAPRPGYWPRLLPLLAVLAAATRLPSFARPLWNPDEGYLAVQAGILAHGGALYETVVDRKPPLVPWLYEAVFALFGAQSLTPLKWCAVAAHLLTAVLLASTARRRWGDGAGRTAGVLYLLVSVGLNPEDTQAATFEVFILPWTAAALWCADRRRWGWCGAAVAGAFLTKQTGAAVLGPVLWMMWRCRAPRAAVVRCAAGVAVPVLAAACATDPGGFLFWTVTGSGSYASFTGSELHVLGRGAVNAALLGAACAGFLPSLARAPRRPAAWLWVWLGSSAVAVLAGFHFFGHYYLQLAPPLALLGAAALRDLPRARVARALLVTACCGGLFVAWGLLAPRPDLAHAERVADAVRARTAPREPVLIWGMHPETYWLADRPPASRFLTAGLLTNYSGGRDGPRVGERWAVPGTWRTFRAEFAVRPPGLVVDDSRGGPYGVGRVGALRRLLAGYERVGGVDGAVLYRPRGSAS
ncbi:glycosyltransferase family 39 protein [Streptomyces sp. NPDC088785]|uniref:glycosyltransferase family 39 protein n=1 Tax=Streptomyces sp. NPDC088785 TaxID=3365897 RepID=UPI00380B2374